MPVGPRPARAPGSVQAGAGNVLAYGYLPAAATPTPSGGIGPTVYVAALTGETITAVAGQGAFQVIPAAAIAALTVVLPPDAIEGTVFEISTTEEIVALTVQAAAGDGIVNGSPGALPANGGISYRYRLFDRTWYPRL